ncbi:MAG: ABC transporter ATP-binding protein [Chloroflexota bacterium]|nr:MAG: nitrate ABC transporter ATP-binding protein [Chloroflexota bacterium]
MTDTATPRIVIDHVTKEFVSREGERALALADVSFNVGANEFVSIVGRSGCGKTTLLNMVAGLLKPSSGRVLVNNRPVEKPGPDRGMVFQQAALFPWLTAIDNIEFGPRNQGVPKAERRRQAQALIELVRLSGFENKYPHELSGGMQQRVAIARALATDPEILLMDEPFGALDELTRSQMQDELLRIWEASRKTVLLVTHSIFEALFLSDRIIILSPHPGRLRKEVKVDLPRPRQRTSKEFLEYYEEVHNAIF